MHIASEPGALWSVPTLPTTAIVLTGVVYLRGWRRARRTRPLELPPWRAWSFIAGLCAAFLAIASPVDTLADDSLLVHMTQHILFMSVIPPLIVLGAPVVPLLRGLPRSLIRKAIGPLLRTRLFHAFSKLAANPVFVVLVMNIAFIAWHVPAAYELALRSEAWHDLEHLCFFVTSLLFWWKIIEPWPSRRPWSPWTKLACLVAADTANTAVSAYLSFCGQLVYPSYARTEHVFGMSAIADQSAAGAAMWVTNGLVFLLPAMIIPLRALAPSFTRGSMMRVPTS